MHKLYCEKSELSIGQLYLLDICDKRKITEFWNTQLNQEFTVGYLMKVATGKYQIPSLKFIYSMLKFLAPTDWFYRETEGSKSASVPQGEYVTDITKSVNYKKLQKLHDERLLNKFCVENFGNKSRYYQVNFLHFLSGRNKLSPNTIKELDNLFPIADWFN